ncbi:MAG: ribonuclease E/G [Hyphomicrobiaceae bacterium]
MEKNRMLIDATHPEETRVVAVRNGRVEDFDFESAARKLLRGNIYLAKVTRVEPSLQAAFVDYGGNRHGFLAFNEIHPDYYQIPVADREALKQEEAEAEAAAEEEADARARSRGPRRRRRVRGDRPGAGAQPSVGTSADGPSGDEAEAGQQAASALSHGHSDDSIRSEPSHDDDGRDSDGTALRPLVAPPIPAMPRGMAVDASAVEARATEEASETREEDDRDDDADEADHDGDRDIDSDGGSDDDDDASDASASDDDQVEQVGSDDDALEELPERPRRRARQYKIQEVIKRRQIMLVQVVKEERGNKGAALTTYISLAGRYTVLMPNTGRGGGISRKITQPQDRKRLKAIAEDLDVPEGMGLIIRTAGAARTKQEIKRDYEYLLRLWESVREVTLSSTAPCLVYEEGSIIKRAIRDLYSKDFDNIVVAGAAAHREAQDFMEMLMPGSGGHVVSYRDPEPLFARYGAERQLNALFSPYVTLKSGGYIVINQTEALVSVDVNSGKSTREFSIEETALNTNVEAAEEIARQLKLRDLAGLIVVDFIDMEEKRNNRTVERRLKDALRHDRARIQVGRISHFGLLEMSRQRLRAGVLEGSTSQCPHCQGTGIIRSIESVALAVLRALEDHLVKQSTSLAASTTAEVALYILNHKRAFIVEMERRYGVLVRVEASDRMHGANFAIERFAAPVAQVRTAPAAVSMEWGFDRDSDVEDDEEVQVEAEVEADEDVGAQHADHASESDQGTRGRRRRRRRGRRDRESESQEHSAGAGKSNGHDHDHDHDHGDNVADRDMDAPVDGDVDDDAEQEPAIAGGSSGPQEDGERNGKRGRRRGRRGGRSRRREQVAGGSDVQPSLDDPDRHEWGIAEIARPGAEQPVTSADDVLIAGRGRRAVRRSSIVEVVGEDATVSASDTAVDLAVDVEQAPQRDDARQHGESRHRSSRDEVRSSFGREARSEADTAATVTATASDLKPMVAAPVPAPIRIKAPEPVAAPIAEEAPAPVMQAVDAVDAPPADVAQVASRSGNGANGAHAHEPEATVEDVAPAQEPLESAPPRPQRRGWWQRRFGS